MIELNSLSTPSVMTPDSLISTLRTIRFIFLTSLSLCITSLSIVYRSECKRLPIDSIVWGSIVLSICTIVLETASTNCIAHTAHTAHTGSDQSTLLVLIVHAGRLCALGWGILIFMYPYRDVCPIECNHYLYMLAWIMQLLPVAIVVRYYIARYVKNYIDNHDINVMLNINISPFRSVRDY